MSGSYLHLDVRNAVKVGGKTLPGILTALSVNGSLEVTQDQFEGSSTHLTNIHGFTTATVALEITLLGTDSQREHQLRVINQVFMVNPSGDTASGTAQAWRVVNPHLDARRIRQMLFTRFDSRDGSDDDSTQVSLEFKELLSEQARLEKAAQQAAATATDPQTGPTPGDTPTPGTGAATPPAPISPFAAGRAQGGTASSSLFSGQNPPPVIPATPGGKQAVTP